MIDFRHKTFLTLCRLKSFTRAADELCITQPAVSQHIDYLEDFYGGKLVTFEGKRFLLTERGQKLHGYVLTMNADCERIETAVRSGEKADTRLVFGATLSIGEYVMPHALERVFQHFPDTSVTMQVHNTQVLLQKLDEGELDFVLLEGFFDKSRYESHLFSLEPFIAAAAPCLCRKKTLTFEELFSERLVLREKGSGTRQVFEQILAERNCTFAQFKSICEIGNMNAIKRLVIDGAGITFLYKTAVNAELASGQLRELRIKNYAAVREFNFVFLKNSQFAAQHLRWFDFFKAW